VDRLAAQPASQPASQPATFADGLGNFGAPKIDEEMEMQKEQERAAAAAGARCHWFFRYLSKIQEN
jgi:hypothetical protein